MSWLGPAISAGASLLGGFFDRADSSKDRAFAQEQARIDRAMQREFAQFGVRWRTADAQAAGIHPIYALGASLPSATPARVGVQSRRGMGAAISRAGAAIGSGVGRAEALSQQRETHSASIEESRTRSLAQRAQAARDFTEASLAASMARGRAQAALAGQDASETAMVTPFGTLNLTPGVATAEDVENRWSDIIGNIYGLGLLGADAMYDWSKRGYPRGLFLFPQRRLRGQHRVLSPRNPAHRRRYPQ